MNLRACKCGSVPSMNRKPNARMAFCVLCKCGAMTPFSRSEAVAGTLWNCGKLLVKSPTKLEVAK